MKSPVLYLLEMKTQLPDKRNYQSLSLEGSTSAGFKKTSWKSPSVVFIVAFVVVLLLATAFISVKLINSGSCDPKPYLYVTLHASNNIAKFSRDGCPIEMRDVWYGRHNPLQLREMKPGLYNGEPVIYVADSADSANGLTSEVLVVGGCSAFNQMRSYVTSIPSGEFQTHHLPITYPPTPSPARHLPPSCRGANYVYVHFEL